MKISKKMNEILNDQICHEFTSSYLYLSMAAYFESQNLMGFAAWMKKQAHEEWGHGMKFYAFVHERLGTVALKAIQEPKSVWKTPLEAFSDAYNHELKITGLIHGIQDSAMAEKDHATASFNRWFVDEQVEEEANADAIVQKLKLIGEHKGALMMLDRELAQRQ